MFIFVGMLITQIIGMKSNGQKQFIVTDAAMTEVIRPALYSAYHHITTLEQDDSSNGCNRPVRHIFFFE